MFPVQLKKGVRFLLSGEEYTILNRLPGQKIEVEEVRYGTTKIFRNGDLVKHLNNGDLRFECTGKNLSNTSESSLKTAFFIEDLGESKYKEHAIFRYEVIRPLIDVPANERNSAVKSRIEEVNAWADDPQKAKENLNGCTYYQKVSYTSIYRWIKYFMEANGDIRALIPSFHCKGGKAKSRLDVRVLDFINETIKEYYNHPQRVTINDIWYDVIHKIEEFNRVSIKKLRHPSYSTMARYVSKIPEYLLIAKRIGSKTAEHKFGMVGKGVDVFYPLERVEIDHTPIDVMLVDENGSCIGRPYLVLAIDKFSRQVLGFSIGISNGVGWPEVASCIRHILTDKSYVKEIYPDIEHEWTAFGLPITLVMDNGLEFKNSAMRDACYQLGFKILFCPPGTPQWKGSIENFFGISNNGLFHKIPGTTRSNPSELGDDENPSELACIKFSMFVYLVHKWIIDVYSQDFNEGANGIPDRIWNKAIEDYPVAWPSNTSETAILLGRTAYRRISRRGIELHCLHYNSEQLNKLLTQFTCENKGLDEDFLVKYDPLNLGEVQVYDHVIYKKWIRVPCSDYEYAHNLSEWEHREHLAYIRKEFGTIDRASLARAKHQIRMMIESQISYSKKEIARVKGVNSEQEIANKLASREDSNIAASSSYKKSQDSFKLVTEAVSDQGMVIESQDIIIPQAVMIQQENPKDNGKVVKINSGRAKKKQAKSSLIVPDEPSTMGEDIFSDLTGFGVTIIAPEVFLHE